MRCTLAIGLLGFMVASVSAGDWAEFRGPTGQGHATASKLPTQWSSSKNVAWKTSIAGLGWSSPIVVGDRIYLTTAVPTGDGEKKDQSLRTICLNAATGKSVWDKEIFLQDGKTAKPIHSKNSHASPTPISDGKHLFVHFGAQGTACLTLDGAAVWQNREFQYEMRHGNGGSPILVDNLLVFSCDGLDKMFVVALDKSTGKVRWQTAREHKNGNKFSFGTPLLIEVNGEKQIVAPGTFHVAAYRPKDGSEVWRVDYGLGYSVIPRPVFGHGLIFLSSGYDTPVLMAIKPDGTGNVTETHVAWKTNKSAPHTPSPLLVGDQLYVVSDGGIATCFNAVSGEQIWQKRIGGNFSASPLFADGKIYLQSEQGDGIVLQPGSEYVELAKNELAPRTFASYAVADGALLIRTETQLYRIQQP
ncbi:MAG: serine/threonine protein kinase [Planctomycetes bacterium]|nr:serine/threonine protein kinase [Planctomycetota bacterium]